MAHSSINEQLDYKILEADKSRVDAYRIFCQKVYQDAYPRPELGITEELFSKEVFESRFVRDYFDRLFAINESNKMWLAIDGEGRILGGIGAKKYDGYVDMRGFYVASEVQGKGIGRALYEQVLAFSAGKPIQAWVYEHLDETIKMYEHWGFGVDKSKGKLDFDWDPWPEDIEMHAICLVRPAGNKDDK